MFGFSKDVVGWAHETIEVLVVTHLGVDASVGSRQGSAAVTSRSDTSCCTERHGAIVFPVKERDRERKKGGKHEVPRCFQFTSAAKSPL